MNILTKRMKKIFMTLFLSTYLQIGNSVEHTRKVKIAFFYFSLTKQSTNIKGRKIACWVSLLIASMASGHRGGIRKQPSTVLANQSPPPAHQHHHLLQSRILFLILKHSLEKIEPLLCSDSSVSANNTTDSASNTSASGLLIESFATAPRHKVKTYTSHCCNPHCCHWESADELSIVHH